MNFPKWWDSSISTYFSLTGWEIEFVRNWNQCKSMSRPHGKFFIITMYFTILIFSRKWIHRGAGTRRISPRICNLCEYGWCGGISLAILSILECRLKSSQFLYAFSLFRYLARTLLKYEKYFLKLMTTIRMEKLILER